MAPLHRRGLATLGLGIALTVGSGCPRQAAAPVAAEAAPEAAAGILAPTVEGPTATSEGAAARLLVAPRGRPGEAARIEVQIVARPGFHLNPDYPHKVELDPLAGGRFAASRIDRQGGLVLTPCADHPDDPCRAVATTTVTAERPGLLSLRARVAYAACDAERCLIEKPTLVAPLTVAP